MQPAHPEPTDAELARRVAHGPDPAGAFDALYARLGAPLLAVLRDRFPSGAEDAAQEAWMRLFACLRRGEDRELTNVRAWLFRIASNVVVDEFRKKRPLALANEADPRDPRQGLPIELLLDAEREALVRRCIGELKDENQRAVIVAVALGQKPTQIADDLGVTRDLVDQWKHRGLKAVRACVERCSHDTGD